MEEIQHKEKISDQSVRNSNLKQKVKSKKTGEEAPVVLSELPVSKRVKIQKLKRNDSHFLMRTDSLFQIHCSDPQRTLICTGCFDQLNLYQVENKKIDFLSSHKILFPEN